MKRLRVAFVVDRFGNRYGGAEAYGVALMRELSAWHDITVFARDYDPQCEVALTYVPVRTWTYWPSWIRVLLTAWRVRRLTRNAYDIVHSHSNGWAGDIEVVHVTPVRYNWRVRRLAWLKRLTAIVSPRVRAYLYLEARRVAPRPGHRNVAVSSLIADQLRQAYGNDIDIETIPPGVDLPGADVHGQRAATRAALSISDGDTVAILVARNPLRKGLKTALQAWAILPSHCVLLVVGVNPAAVRAIEALCGDPQIRARLRLVPPTSDVAPYYRAADLCVHPTLNDSFGMAPLEAMSFGLPVVISPAPACGFAAYLRHESDALVLKAPDDANDLALCITRLLDDKALRREIAAGGRAVAQRHAWPAIARRYQALYEQIMAERFA